ncbi:MAG: hypothetical protein ACOC4M_11015 [Promethearchaeia archaeon]
MPILRESVNSNEPIYQVSADQNAFKLRQLPISVTGVQTVRTALQTSPRAGRNDKWRAAYVTLLAEILPFGLQFLIIILDKYAQFLYGVKNFQEISKIAPGLLPSFGHEDISWTWAKVQNKLEESFDKYVKNLKKIKDEGFGQFIADYFQSRRDLLQKIGVAPSLRGQPEALERAFREVLRDFYQRYKPDDAHLTKPDKIQGEVAIPILQAEVIKSLYPARTLDRSLELYVQDLLRESQTTLLNFATPQEEYAYWQKVEVLHRQLRAFYGI